MPPENITTDIPTYASTGTTLYITTASEIAPYVITTTDWSWGEPKITTTDWSCGRPKQVTLTKEELYEAIRGWNCDADGLIQEMDIGDPVIVERQDDIVPPTSEELFEFLGI